ncbi:MAG: MBL fold metallo-hydrolase [Gemmatimonadetes bacterium]|nr:MBL fold metallo-hydrolase [Gemmatimonadota bacterium]
MRWNIVCPLALVVPLTTAPGKAQAPRELVTGAVNAMGGEPAVRAVGAITLSFHTATFALGQEETPASPARATVAYGRIVTDLRGNRQLFEQEVRQLTGQVTRQRRITAGGIGLLETDGRQTPAAAGAAAAAERAMRLSPERLLLAALDHPSTLSALPAREWRGSQSHGVRYAAGPDTLALYFDRWSGLLLVTETVTDDPILGDRRTVTWFTRWQPAGAIQLPRQVDIEVNGRLQSHTIYTTATVGDAPADAFVIPDSIANRAQRASAASPPIVVQLVQLAPGVWRAEGGSHHSLVIEQPQQLVVVEGPQTTARSRAVLDTLRTRFPNKRVGVVVNTHHHWDHSGGLRGYMAAGVPVLTHARNAAFVRQIAAAAKTVAPDQLTRTRQVPAIQTVEDSLTIGSGDSRVVLYRLPTVHVEGMLMAYVPQARLLFASDVLTPAAPLNPAGSAEMVAAARAPGLAVDRFAGGHGGVANWADVERAAQP